MFCLPGGGDALYVGIGFENIVGEWEGDYTGDRQDEEREELSLFVVVVVGGGHVAAVLGGLRSRLTEGTFTREVAISWFACEKCARSELAVS